MLSLYDISVPVFIHGLRNLDAFLAKGADWFAEQGRPESELTGARLIADMGPLTFQIQRASDTAKAILTRVAGMEPVGMADEEVTIADLRARIAKTIALLEAAPREAFDGKEDTQVVLKTPSRTLTFRGRDYVLGYALPNFFFHVATAYDLLRKEGVPLVKMDYLNVMAAGARVA